MIFFKNGLYGADYKGGSLCALRWETAESGNYGPLMFFQNGILKQYEKNMKTI